MECIRCHQEDCICSWYKAGHLVQRKTDGEFTIFEVPRDFPLVDIKKTLGHSQTRIGAIRFAEMRIEGQTIPQGTTK